MDISSEHCGYVYMYGKEEFQTDPDDLGKQKAINLAEHEAIRRLRDGKAAPTDYSRMIAKKLGLSKEEQEKIYYMGLVHDIGKIGVPGEIINKTSKLTDEEYELIKSHSIKGYEILDEIQSMPDLALGARWHHELYDGSGYPDKKAGDDIPFLMRIIAVADSYDAMTSNRSYRSYLPQDVVRAEIEKNSGKQFDPAVAECMLQIIDADRNYSLHE